MNRNFGISAMFLLIETANVQQALQEIAGHFLLCMRDSTYLCIISVLSIGINTIFAQTT